MKAWAWDGAEPRKCLTALAPMHQAWFLLAAVADPTTSLVDAVEKEVADEAHAYRPHPDPSPRP
jgi:hypothetical protein